MADQLTRGNLPHWYKPGYAHFITYRVVDSLPANLRRQLSAEREQLLKAPLAEGSSADEQRLKIHKQMFAKYDAILDRPSGWQPLSNSAAAASIRENLYHHHQSKYELIAFCVMSNHVHVVLQPFQSALAPCASSQPAIGEESADGTHVLSEIMHSLKSFTANKINGLLHRSGPFWQRESYDHWIRDAEELERVVAYVIGNPVKAGLCQHPQDWPCSSAHDRYQLDGSVCGLVGWLRDDWHQR
jgi:putative DNA methylase